MIQLEGIERMFQVGDEQVHALREVNLRFPNGCYASIMGPSGSGKSTLLNVLGLLDRPDRGIYRLDDLVTNALGDREQARIRRHKIGFVFQAFHLVPRLSAAENVELPMMLAAVPPQERHQRVQAALTDLGLEDRAGHRPDQLSGGQRQRVAIARATIMHPEVILADEPTGNLDHVSGRTVIDTLERLNRQGITLLIVTHDPEIGERAPRHIRLVDGQVAEDSAPP